MSDDHFEIGDRVELKEDQQMGHPPDGSLFLLKAGTQGTITELSPSYDEITMTPHITHWVWLSAVKGFEEDVSVYVTDGMIRKIK